MRYLDHPDQDLNPLAFAPEAGTMRLYGKSDPPPPPDYAAAARETSAGNIAAAQQATEANRINQFTPYGSLTYERPNAANNNTWTQKQTLTPQAQSALDQELSLNKKYGEVANIGFDKARSIFENPELDMSQMPERAVAPGQTAQQAIMARLQPQLAQQEEALRTQMANQGITLGSNAYGQEMNQQGQRRNDLEMQAAMQGISLDQQARTAAMQEQAYMQDRPLNLINALRSGNQVNAPQFQQFANQQTVAGPNLLGAADSQYGAAVDATNAKNAQTSGMMSGLLGIGLGIGGMSVKGGGSLLGNFLGG